MVESPELTAEEISTLKDVANSINGEADIDQLAQVTGVSRRTILKIGAALGVGGIVGGGAANELVGEAQAAPDTSDGDGNVGLPDDRVDVFADGVDANQVGTSSSKVSDIYGGTGDFSEVSTGTATIDGNSALREGGKSYATPGFGTVVQISADRPSLVTVTAQAKTDGSTRALVQLAVDETGDGSGDEFKTIARQAPTGSGDTSQSTATAYLRPGEQYFVRNVDDPNNGNGLNNVDEVIL